MQGATGDGERIPCLLVIEHAIGQYTSQFYHSLNAQAQDDVDIGEAVMSAVADLTASSASITPRAEAAGQKPKTDAQAIAVAKQAIDQAYARVDADRRVHSPGCVAVDQKGVDKASAELAHLQSQENTATVGSQALSISV